MLQPASIKTAPLQTLGGSADTHPSKNARSGILVLSFSRAILYASPQAELLLEDLKDILSPSGVIRELPQAILELCEALEARVLQCKSEHDWNQIPVEHTTHAKQFTVKLQAFCLPPQNKLHGSQILILCERIGIPPSSPQHQHAAELLLTDRQRSIATGVIRGLTNKELAQELGLSLHTVKEYIRQIMMRLNTSSRAGIVGRMVGLVSETKKASHSRSPQQDNQTVS